jgi:putative ABC transport system substrate-binding protein
VYCFAGEDTLNRRNSLKAIAAAGTVLLPLELLAQSRPGNRPFRIGMPVKFVSAEARSRFVAGMLERGWRENQDYIFVDFELPFEPARAEEGVRRILAEKPDLIFAVSTAYAVAAHRLTKTVPIVMFSSGYPVEAGVAHSLARPGKNVTGNSIYAGTGIWGKFLELLRESRPGIQRVGVLWGYVPPAFPVEEVEPCYRELRQGAAALGMAVNIVETETPERVPAALDAIAAGRPDALLVTSTPWSSDSWPQIVKFTTERKLPTISDFAPFPEDKRPRPLLIFAPNLQGLRGVAFSYIDRILKGANPADLPIQQPSKFDLVVDLRTARAIGLTLPQSILLRADKVID